MLISDTQAIKNEMAIVKYKVQRSTTLLQSLLGERERWQQQTSTFGDSLSTLVGNVVLSSAFLVYLGMFDQETRASLRQHICASLVDAKIPFDEALDYAEYLSQADERLLWHANALPEDALCVENAVMIKRFNRYPLVIDPSGQASSFLMKQFAGRQIAKTSFMVCLLSHSVPDSLSLSPSLYARKKHCSDDEPNPAPTRPQRTWLLLKQDASFMKNLESAMRFGMPLLVTDVESIDPILNPVLNREISRSGGRMLIRLGDQDIDFSPAFDLYLCTRDPACRFSPDLCSRVTLINFTVTPGGLQNQCLSAVLKAERPDVDQERCELLKLQGEYRARLTQLEKQLLQALGEDEGNFLDDDKIVSTLERIKTDSRDIQDKMQQQEAVRARVHEVTLLYQPLAQASSRIFFSLRALADLNPLYHFSVKTFLHLFTRVVTNKARLDAFSDQSDRLQVLTHDLFEASFCHACISLQDRHKLSLALHLAHLRLVSKVCASQCVCVCTFRSRS
jgi:dynein heavy chain 1